MNVNGPMNSCAVSMWLSRAIRPLCGPRTAGGQRSAAAKHHHLLHVTSSSRSGVLGDGRDGTTAWCFDGALVEVADSKHYTCVAVGPKLATLSLEIATPEHQVARWHSGVAGSHRWATSPSPCAPTPAPHPIPCVGIGSCKG